MTAAIIMLGGALMLTVLGAVTVVARSQRDIAASRRHADQERQRLVSVHAADVAEVRQQLIKAGDDHQKAIERLNDQQRVALDAATARHASELHRYEIARADELSRVDARHAAELERLEAVHKAELEAVHGIDVRDLHRQHAAELERVRGEYRELLNRFQHPHVMPTGTQPVNPMAQARQSEKRSASDNARLAWRQVGTVAPIGGPPPIGFQPERPAQPVSPAAAAIAAEAAMADARAEREIGSDLP